MKFLVGIIIGFLFASDVLGATVQQTGPATSAADNAASAVACPAGYAVVRCRCSSQANCDSNWVIGNTCRVTHTGGKPVVQPIATCDNAVDEYEVDSSGYASSPTVSCPDDLVVRSCGLFYPMAHMNPNIMAIRSGQKTCVPSARCTGGRGCRVQAVCVDR
ncbi:uncharacterized protein LOC141912243 [Tubulanus polymorphus]|uniref:uncharacterized protein LOC141912243 n=1 Tax=Tubulanus polymorphus TaxID=672921 RepID=UPI003DA69C81